MPELSYRHRVLILAICGTSLFIVGVDITIVNIALPAIQHGLHTRIDGAQWVMAAYTLTLASLLVLGGSTADRLGRRRVFLFGVATFTTGSLLCGLAPGLGALIGFRVFQAVGGACMNPIALSIIIGVFTSRRERAIAIGVWNGILGLSLAFGPVVGGGLVSDAGWRAIFWINVPIGIVVVILTWFFVPESHGQQARRFDPFGQVLVIVLFGSLTYAIIEAPFLGWASAQVNLLSGLAGLAAVLLVLYELRRCQPLIEMRFFSSVPFAGATVIAVGAFGAISAFLFLNVLYLQMIRHLGPADTWRWLLPVAGVTLVLAPLSGVIVGSRGPRVPLVLAGAGLTAGSAMLSLIDATSSGFYLLACFLVFAIGWAFVNPPITNTAMSAMPLAQASVAAAMASTCRQLGASLGVAVSGSLINSGHGFDPARFVSGSRFTWWMFTGVGAAILTLAIITTGPWARGTAERLGADLGAEPGPPAPSGTA